CFVDFFFRETDCYASLCHFVLFNHDITSTSYFAVCGFQYLYSNGFLGSAFVQQGIIVGVAYLPIANEIGCARRFNEFCFHCTSVIKQKSKKSYQQNQNCRIGFHFIGKFERNFLFYFIFCSITNESFWKAYFYHYFVAGVDTRCTVYAFQLLPVSDVDSCRTNDHTLVTINTVAFSGSTAVFTFSPFGPVFSAFKIVKNIDGLFVYQHALKPSVRTYQCAHLLSEPCEYKIKSCCEKNHHQKIRWMLERAFLHNLKYSLISYDIHEHDMSNNNRNHRINKPFQAPFPDFLCVPRLIIQPYLLVSVSFDGIFNLTENHFHENCLRANPPAENSPENYCKKNNEDDRSDST